MKMNRFKKGDLIYDTYDKFFRIFRVVATTEERNEELRNYGIKGTSYAGSLVLNLVDGLTYANNDQLSSFRSLDEDYPTIAKAIRGEKILIDDKYCQNRISELSTHLYCKNNYALSLESRMIELRQERDNAQQKLAAYEDETYISEDWLLKNGFEKREYDYLYCNDVVEISAQEIDREAGVWRVEVAYLDSGYPKTLDICTLGELRMFLAIEGLDNLVNEFKS